MGVDFNPYLSRVLHDVRQHWFALIPESVGTKKGKVVLEFAILKDGSVAGLKVVGSSGDIALDRPAYGSITGSNSFPPLPSEFKGPYLGLRFSFYYNVGPGISPMSPLVEDIRKKMYENHGNDKNAKPDLEHDVTVLTKLLDAGGLDATDVSAARYYRALAQHLLGVLRKQDGVAPDTAAAEQALSEMDSIIADKSNIPLWSITIPEVEFEAGGIAWTELHGDSRAYSYWQRCADSGHAGCMVDLAGAYTVGLGGIQPDPAKALDLNLKAFDTGSKYTCTGSIAAVDVAQLIYFMGAQYPKDNDPVSWMHKSYALSDAIEARPSSKNICGGSGGRIEEFLYRLARGDRQKELLAQATQHLGDDTTALTAVIDYLSGTIDVKAFEATVESSKSEGGRCSAYFHARWYADLAGDRALVNKFSGPLSNFDHLTCPVYLVFAKKFHADAPQSHPPASQP
jgi:TonB family protein